MLNTTRSTGIRVLAALAAAAFVLAGCSGGGESDNPGGSPEVRLQAMDQGTSGLALKTIEELKLDEKYGFSAEFQYVGADASSQNFLQGQSDINFDSAPTDAALANENGHDMVIFSPEAVNHAVIIAPAGSPIDSLQSLKGKKIGWYGSDATAAVATNVFLRTYRGINFFDEYEFIKSSPSALVQLLVSGQVDAVLTFQPWVSWAQNEVPGGVKVVYDPGADWKSQTGGSMWMTSLAAKRDWLESNKDTAGNILAAWCEAADYLNNNIDEVVAARAYQKFLEPLDDDGLRVFADYVKQTSPFTCRWTDEQIVNTNKFLDALAADGSTFRKNAGNYLVKLDEPSVG